MAGHLDPESDHDFGLGLGFATRGFDAGVQYYDAQGLGNWATLAAPTGSVDDAVRGHLGCTRPVAFSLGLSYERLESDLDSGEDYLCAVGTLNVTPAAVVSGSFGRVGDSGAIQPVSRNGFTGGVFHTLLPQARLHLLYSYLDTDEGPSWSDVAAGFIYQFVLRP